MKKEIKISEELYNNLIDLSKEYVSQENRATRMPYLFLIREEVESLCSEGYGDEVWVQDGSICIRTELETKEAVFEFYEWDLNNEVHNELYKDLEGYEKENILEQNYRRVYIEKTFKYSNAFFTAKGCKEHIRQNSHRYNNPVDFLDHAFRNKEMTIISNLFQEIVEQNQ